MVMLRERLMTTKPSASRDPLTPKAKPARTVSADELPSWAHTYDFVTAGYRNPSHHDTWASVFFSALTWHTESVNVHTHLWPGLGCFLVLTLRVPMDCFQTASPLGQASTVVSCVGCGVMMLFSATAHLIHVLSPSVEKVAWKLDMVGIAVSAWGRLFSDLWVFFGVYLRSVAAFAAAMTAASALALFCVYRTWQGHFDVSLPPFPSRPAFSAPLTDPASSTHTRSTRFTTGRFA